MNEADYLVKNYGRVMEGVIRRGRRPRRIALRDPHNSSYDTKAEFNNCFIIHS